MTMSSAPRYHGIVRVSDDRQAELQRMQCASCNGEIGATDTFCSTCGTRVQPACAACGHPNERGSRFCSRCGEPLLFQNATSSVPSGSARVQDGERKRLTVLFADIRNSTAMIEELDPEETHIRLDRIIGLMKDAVDRFDGTVTKVQGDGVMALFGAPKPNEDHAVCACLAALAMREALAGLGEADLGIRVGIHTGEVVVHTTRSHVSQSYDASGLTVHLASRMEQMSDETGILLTSETFNAAKHHVDARPLGNVAVRGLRAPVGVHALIGRRQSPVSDRFRSSATLTAFAGRDGELAALETELALVRAGQGRIVSVIGDAGLGKSRLCFEFAERCRRQDVRVYEARVLPHGRATPFQPVLEIFRSVLGVRPGDAKEIARAQVVASLEAFGKLEGTIPILLDFLGLQDPASPAPKLDPKTRKARLLELVRRLPKLVRQSSVNVVLLEDLHWIDAASDEFVSALADGVAGTTTLLLVNHRPGYGAGWMQRSHCRQLRLEPLSGEHASLLIDAAIGKTHSLRAIRAEIAARAQGNPFFLEELVQSLIDRERHEGKPESSRGAKVALPATVQAVLAARIDQLPPYAKQALQTAAVLARQIKPSTLAKVMDTDEAELGDAMRHLRGMELLYEPQLSDRGLHEFRHPLIQEVAYESLLLSRRRELHAKVADALEEELKDRLDEGAGLIAYHLEEAGELNRAAQAHVRGAMWAGANDSAQAMRGWRKVRELLKGSAGAPASSFLRMMACGQLMNFGWREGIAVEEAAGYFREAQDIALGIGDRRANALLLAGYGRILAASGSADEYVEKVREAEAVSMGSSDPSLEVTLKAVLCNALRLSGRMAEAFEVNGQALARCSEVGSFDRQMLGFDVETWLIGMRGSTLVFLGRGDEGRPFLDQVLAMDPKTVDTTHHVLPSVAYVDLAAFLGDAALADHHARRAIAIAQQSANPYLRVYALCCRGIARRLAGRLDESIEDLEEALKLSEQRNAGREIEARLLAELGQSFGEQGDRAKAAGTLREAVRVAGARHARLPECQARIALARFVLALPSEREAEADRARLLVRETGAIAYGPQVESISSRRGDADGRRDPDDGRATAKRVAS